MNQLTVRLPETLTDALEAQVRRSRTTTSNYVAKALWAAIEADLTLRTAPPPPLPDDVQQAVKLAALVPKVLDSLLGKPTLDQLPTLVKLLAALRKMHPAMTAAHKSGALPSATYSALRSRVYARRLAALRSLHTAYCKANKPTAAEAAPHWDMLQATYPTH